MENQKHIPVLLNEVMRLLNPIDNGVYIDGTFGNGGYSLYILQNFNAKIIAFDRDSSVLNRVDEFKKLFGNRFMFFQDTFSNILSNMEKNNINQVDGLMLDIGVSSMQIDNPERGFSFRFDAPINMEMGKNEFSAFEVINNFSETELANIFFEFGEEARARQIAKRIISMRNDKPIKTTFDLVNVIKAMYGEWQSQKIIPKIFQAIRIFVNDELGELKKVLSDSYNILKNGGRCVVVDFHSLEDRIVKNFINENCKSLNNNSRYLPDIEQKQKRLFKNLQKSVIIPSALEIENNPRARSAKLRGFEKI